LDDVANNTDVIVAQMLRFPFFISPMSFEIVTVILNKNIEDNTIVPCKQLGKKTESPDIDKCEKDGTLIRVIDKAEGMKEMTLNNIIRRSISYKTNDEKLSISFVIEETNVTTVHANLVNDDTFYGISLNECELKNFIKDNLDGLNKGSIPTNDDEKAKTYFQLEKNLSEVIPDKPIWLLLYEKIESGKTDEMYWNNDKCTLHAIKTLGFGNNFNENLILTKFKILETVNITFKDVLYRYDEESRKYVETDKPIDISDVEGKGLKGFKVTSNEISNTYREGDIISVDEYSKDDGYEIYKSNLENGKFDIKTDFIFEDDIMKEGYDVYVKHENTNYKIESNKITISSSYNVIKTIYFEIFYVESNEN
jgi:hypothetical protein